MAIFTFGSNLGSQLAHPSDFDDTPKPTRLPFFDNKEVQKIACGSLHNLVLIENKVYSYGCDDEAALGRKGPEHEVLEVKIKDDVIDIACGSSHSCVLTKKGVVYGWGTFRDQGGVIGFSPKVRLQRAPVKIVGNIEKIISCDNYIAMVSKGGSLICYGPDLYKKDIKLRVSNKNRAVSQRQMCLQTRVVMRKTRKSPKIDKLRSGANHCMFLSDKEVYGYGNNNCGQMGNGEKYNFNEVKKLNISDVIECDGAMTHSLFLKTNGDLYASGSNTHGNIGVESVGKETLVPVKILDNVNMIACAGSMNMAVRNNELYGWGGNFYGELGCTKEKVNVPTKIDFDFGEILDIKVGCNHTVVLTKDTN